jgi:hypothetical protein
MSKPAKKRPTASAPATVPTTKSSRHSAGDRRLYATKLIYINRITVVSSRWVTYGLTISFPHAGAVYTHACNQNKTIITERNALVPQDSPAVREEEDMAVVTVD